MPRISPIVIGLALVLAFVAACGDDAPVRPGPGTPADTTGTLRGTFLRASDAAPFGPAIVHLYDLGARAVIDRTTADTTGVFVFRAIPDGAYLPVLESDAAAPFHLPRPRWVFTDGEDYDDVILVAPLPVQLSPDDNGIAGTVVDDATGEPVAFARVEMNSLTGGANWSQRSTNGSEYRGHTSTQETVADSLGAFRIVPVPIVAVPVDPQGVEFRVPSWRVVAPGYVSRSFPSAVANGEVRTVEVRLNRGTDDAAVTGRIVDRAGQPVEGVPIVAEWRRARGELLRGPAPERVIVGTDGISGPDGTFRIGSLPEGAYSLLAGIEPDDGWVDLTGIQGLDVIGETAVGDVVVGAAMEFVDLPVQATLGDTLRWTPVEGAASYLVRARRGLDVTSASAVVDTPLTVFDFPGAPFDSTTVFRLEAEARDADGALLSRTDRPALIHWIVDPDL